MRHALVYVTDFCVFHVRCWCFVMLCDVDGPAPFIHASSLCSISGGTYILRWSPAALVHDITQHRYTGMITPAAQYITSTWIVCDDEHVPAEWKLRDVKEESVSRAICLVDGAVR